MTDNRLTIEKPRRVQLRRSKGWKMPPNTVKVDRTTKWGNPFIIGKPGGAFTACVADRRHAWQLFRSIARDNKSLVKAAREELRGKNLACWCPLPTELYQLDECHAAVLLEIANPYEVPVYVPVDDTDAPAAVKPKTLPGGTAAASTI